MKTTIILADAELDHIVIAAASLEQGEEFISSKLGIQPSPGGSHPEQGTHNSLLKLGSNQYLEIISIDPEAGKPNYPRWFNLDDPDLQKQIARRPRVITWVARTEDMESALSQATYDPGNPRSASRGSLRWTFTFSEDGAIVQHGLLPHLIEWHSPDHPSFRLPESATDITRIKAFHPSPDGIRESLESLGLQDVLELHESSGNNIGLEVTFNCPSGEVTLGGA